MAKTVPCKTCNHQVAKNAKLCPSCGVKDPGLTFKDTMIGFLGFIVLVVIGSIWLNSCTDEEAASPKETKMELNQAQSYQLLSADDFSYPGRKRQQFNIAAPTANTFERLSQTAIQAAIDYQRQYSLDVIYVFIGNDMEQINNGEAFAIARYAPDGGGNSGDQDWKWQVEASQSSEIEPESFIIREPYKLGDE